MTRQNSRFDVVGQLAALRRYARSLTRSEVAADDLVQSALVRAYEKRSQFREGANIRSWLLSVMHNLHIDDSRRSQAEARRLEQIALANPGITPPAQEHHVRLAEVRGAFMSLPEEQRAVLHLVAVEGLSFAEAADALKIPIGTLMSRLARGRAALRAFDEGLTEQGKPIRRARLKIVGGSDGPSS